MTIKRDELLELFLSYYPKTNNNYRSAIKNYVLDDYKIDSSSINYENYLKMLDNTSERTQSSQQSYCRQFIFFLYCYGHIKDSRFVEVLSEKEVKKFKEDMEAKKRELEAPKVISEKENRTKTLNFEDFTKIQNFMQLETNKKNYKIQFIIYMIVWLDFPVDELRNGKIGDKYRGGYLENTSKGDVEVPFRFREFIEKHKPAFSTISGNLRNLGVDITLSVDLTPTILQQSRKKIISNCLNCDREYLQFDGNLFTVNNMIVCKSCAEELKKKYIVDSFEAQILKPVVKLVLDDYILFNKLKEDLIKTPIDYLKLHEFQMAIGDLGEQWVYEYEMDNLEGTKFADMVDKSKAKDNLNGYDILSYTTNGKKIYIEVKTTSTLNDEFYISQHELEVAEQMKKNGEMYKVYFVKDILGEPQLTIIDNIIDEIEFKKIGHNWKMIKE
ncbi:DUF3883 domain-containing protein [Lysinibacillus xylanilyticus]|uniref:DUF3883 domain-containing protein n=1 Tax=Lysinibacillus xylanilyticus TaxID=582475 RepID=UPI003D011A74